MTIQWYSGKYCLIETYKRFTLTMKWFPLEEKTKEVDGDEGNGDNESDGGL